ncbi:MAG: hypothetical protein ABRQ24_01775 [Syntrophomonadaceae bacterium]
MIDLNKQIKETRGIWKYSLNGKSAWENYMEQRIKIQQRYSRTDDRYIVSKKSLNKTIDDIEDTILKGLGSKLSNR